MDAPPGDDRESTLVPISKPDGEAKMDDEMLGACVISELCRSQARGDAGVKARRGQFAALGRIIRAADNADVELVFGVRK